MLCFFLQKKTRYMDKVYMSDMNRYEKLFYLKSFSVFLKLQMRKINCFYTEMYMKRERMRWAIATFFSKSKLYSILGQILGPGG